VGVLYTRHVPQGGDEGALELILILVVGLAIGDFHPLVDVHLKALRFDPQLACGRPLGRCCPRSWLGEASSMMVGRVFTKGNNGHLAMIFSGGHGGECSGGLEAQGKKEFY